MAFDAAIRPGSAGPGVGTISLNTDEIRGEGGPHDARLVLPLVVRLEPQPERANLGLTELTVALHLTSAGGPVFPATQVGPCVSLLGGTVLPCIPGSSTSYPIEARVPLSQAIIAQIEGRRHESPDKAFTAVMNVGGTLAWLYKRAPLLSEGEASYLFARSDWPFAPNVGIASLVAPFWDTVIDDLFVRIPEAMWVANVLPGLGLDRLRLVEIAAPTDSGPLPACVVPLFDDAQRDYDAGRYRECVGKCRDVRHAVEQHLGATKAQPVAAVVAAQLALPPDAAERTFLDDAWKALGDVTNSAHHIGPAGAPSYSAAAARTCLFLTATLLDYLRHLYLPPPIGRHP